ncbi:MAG: methyltransferase domain-containing protein [Pyrinomonadaceae bacterium]
MNDTAAFASSEAGFIYDHVPYPIVAFSQTHPDMLATMGRFYGVEAADPTNCRVLEIGCGTGANLMFMAYTLPQSEFVGIDLSAVQIDGAAKWAQELAISNTKFQQQDITDCDPEALGKFDYIIAHGVYSWVPEHVRESILKLYSQCLDDNGIGFISFNAYPGCHLRQMLWEPLRFHVKDITPWQKQVEDGRRFLAALTNSMVWHPTLQSIARTELKEIINKPAPFVLHDELGDVNQPFYFHEFMERSKQFGLKFVAEADRKWLNMGNLTEDVRVFLQSLGPDVERREQYLDLIRCGRFRSVILCKNNVDLIQEMDAGRMGPFLIASQVKQAAETEEIDGSGSKTFIMPDGSSFDIDHPLAKAVLVCLGARWPRRIAFDDLIGEAAKMLSLSDEDDISNEAESTARCLVELSQIGVVKFHSYHPSFSETVSEYPRANLFVQSMVRAGAPSVSTLTEPMLELSDEVVGYLIPLLDGSRSIQDLIDEIKILVRVKPEEEEEFAKALPEKVKTSLNVIAEAGLLVE